MTPKTNKEMIYDSFNLIFLFYSLYLDHLFRELICCYSLVCCSFFYVYAFNWIFVFIVVVLVSVEMLRRFNRKFLHFVQMFRMFFFHIFPHDDLTTLSTLCNIRMNNNKIIQQNKIVLPGNVHLLCILFRFILIAKVKEYTIFNIRPISILNRTFKTHRY